MMLLHVPASKQLYAARHNALNETALQNTIEARKLKLQSFFPVSCLLIDQTTDQILHSDWVNLDGRDSPLIS